MHRQKITKGAFLILGILFSFYAFSQPPFSRGVNLTGWFQVNSPDVGNILTRVWSRIADHLKDRSDYILYEILNESHGITTSVWGATQGQVINTIREKDTRHIIIATIDGSYASWDSKWHHVNIPLSALVEKGSWDHNTWYDPQGKFDWSAIDRFEISMEDPVNSGKHLWFDNNHITNLDTAIVRQYGALGVMPVTEQSPLDLYNLGRKKRQWCFGSEGSVYLYSDHWQFARIIQNNKKLEFYYKALVYT